MKTAAIALGSNMGDRLGNLRQAVHLLENQRIRVTARSDVFETNPVGFENQKRFLNACILVQTDLSPIELLAETQRVETQLGRTREVRWGPRTIDLDILLFDEMVVNEKTLVIPHPRMTERAFVLVPLAQICPGRIHPGTGETIGVLSERIRREDRSMQRIAPL